MLYKISVCFFLFYFEHFFAFGFDFPFDFRCRLGLGCSHQFNGNGDVGSNKRGKAKDQNDDVEQICFTTQQNYLGLLNQSKQLLDGCSPKCCDQLLNSLMNFSALVWLMKSSFTKRKQSFAIVPYFKTLFVILCFFK